MDERLEVTLKGGEFKRILESQFSGVREKYKLKKVEIDVLYFLARREEYDTPTEIHRHLKLNRGHVSQAIDSLCKRQYIIAIPDKDDRRYMHYSITNEAQEVISDIMEIRKNLDETIFKGITDEELEIYKKVTEKICINMKEMLK